MTNAWNTIKDMLRDGTSRVVVVEGDQVTHVVLSVEEYARLRGTAPGATARPEHEPQRFPDMQEGAPGSIRIEDLPL